MSRKGARLAPAVGTVPPHRAQSPERPFWSVGIQILAFEAPPKTQGPSLRFELEHNPMEKTIARWSYWLGITCVIVTIAWKGGNVFGLWRALPPSPAEISYWSFYNASLVFFATSIASACRVWLMSISKEVGMRKRPTRKSADGTEPEAPISIAA